MLNTLLMKPIVSTVNEDISPEMIVNPSIVSGAFPFEVNKIPFVSLIEFSFIRPTYMLLHHKFIILKDNG